MSQRRSLPAVLSTLAVALVGNQSPCEAAPPEFHSLVQGDDPVLWYQFNELTGTPAATNHGSFGPAFDGTYFNGVTLETATASGDPGAGFSAPSQQYVDSGDAAPPSLEGNPTFTAEVVVYIPKGAPASHWPPFLHWGDPTTGRSVYFSLQANRNNVVYAGFFNGGLRTVDPIALDQWNHIVWVRDSDGGNHGQWDGTTVYINGVNVPLEIDTDLPGAPVVDVASTSFRVQRARSSTRHFTGIIDEVVLYPRILTGEEIIEHFEALNLDGCSADWNNDGAVNSSDFFAFLEGFSSGNADFDGNGATNSADFFAFLQAFDAGC